LKTGLDKMKLNRIQIQIFAKLAKEKELDIEEYLSRYSRKYLGRTTTTLEDVTEDEGDAWINQVYLESLG